MWKHYWGLWLAIVLLLAISITGLSYILSSTSQLTDRLPPLEQAIAAEDWPEALAQYARLQQEWQKASRVWQLMINHDDMRDIEIAFVDLKVMLEEQNKEQSNKELAGLSFYLSHVPQNERLSLQNIL